MQKVDRYFMFPETNAKCVEDRSVTDYAKKTDNCKISPYLSAFLKHRNIYLLFSLFLQFIFHMQVKVRFSRK